MRLITNFNLVRYAQLDVDLTYKLYRFIHETFDYIYEINQCFEIMVSEYETNNKL